MMKPTHITASKAASLANAYRQFKENPLLTDRSSGLTRMECYKLIQEVRLFYELKNENIVLNFLDKVADGRIVLEGTDFTKEHEEKVVTEYDDLLKKTDESSNTKKILFSSTQKPPEEQENQNSAGAQQNESVNTQDALVQTNTELNSTDEIKAWHNEQKKTELQSQLVSQGLSQEQSEVYTNAISSRLNELGDETSTESVVKNTIQEVVPGINTEQLDFTTKTILNNNSEDRSNMGFALDAFKYQTKTKATDSPTSSLRSESPSQIIVRLRTRELPFLEQFKNSVLNQIIPGRLEKQEAIARANLEQGLNEFTTNHPSQQNITRGLQEASKNPELLRTLDPKHEANFYLEGENPPYPGTQKDSTIQFEFNKQGSSGGSITIRSLGRGMPTEISRSRDNSNKSAGFSPQLPSVSNSFTTLKDAALRTKDVYKLATGERAIKISSFISRAASVLGKRAGAFLATSVAPAIGSAVSATLGGLTAMTSAVVGGLTAATAGAGAPVVGTVLVIVVIVAIILFFVFGFFSISENQRLYVPDASQSAINRSEYIDVEAKFNPDSFKGDLPVEAEITIVVRAKKGILNNVRFSESFSVISKNDNPTPPTAIKHDFPISLDGGESETISYKIFIDSKYKDSIITDTITVSAKAAGEEKDELVIVSTSILIGESPTGCFTFEGDWTNPDKSLELQAIGTLLRNSTFTGKLCKDNKPIRLIRSYEPETYGGMVPGDSQIIIYSFGLQDNSNTLYTLAHEAGHILAQRDTGLFRSFPEKVKGESLLPTYPLVPVDKISEDFAETVALFTTWKEKIFSCCGKVNFSKEFAKHYNFAFDDIFGRQEY